MAPLLSGVQPRTPHCNGIPLMSRITSIDGLPVIDAKRPLTLKVTKGDIAKAAESTKEPNKCAVLGRRGPGDARRHRQGRPQAQTRLPCGVSANVCPAMVLNRRSRPRT